MPQETTSQKKIIIPLPAYDFDPTEVAIPWKKLREQGCEVMFSTPDGQVAAGDAMMLSGEGLDPWGWIPVLKKIRFVGLILRADKQARMAYQEMQRDHHFQNPCKYIDLKVDSYDGLLLPGGHAPRMKPYLEDTNLQAFVVDFFESKNESGQHKPIAALCHGVVLAARSVSKSTGKSVLYGKQTTGLTWALENSAWKLTKYFARFWDPGYYRTYMEEPGEPKAFRSVEHEIKRALKNADDFLDVPKSVANYALKTSGVARDSSDNSNAAWVVQDGNYLSARWPGDAHTLAREFARILNSYKNS